MALLPVRICCPLLMAEFAPNLGAAPWVLAGAIISKKSQQKSFEGGMDAFGKGERVGKKRLGGKRKYPLTSLAFSPVAQPQEFANMSSSVCELELFANEWPISDERPNPAIMNHVFYTCVFT